MTTSFVLPYDPRLGSANNERSGRKKNTGHPDVSGAGQAMVPPASRQAPYMSAGDKKPVVTSGVNTLA